MDDLLRFIYDSGLAIFLDCVSVGERVAIVAKKKCPQTQRQHHLDEPRHSARAVRQVCAYIIINI